MDQIQNFSPNFNPDQPTYELKPKKKKKKKRKGLKIFFISLLVIILLPIVGYFALDLVGRIMTKPFDDSDLRLKPINIKPEDNGYLLMQEAEKHLIAKDKASSSNLLKEVFKENKWNEAVIQEILTRNQKAIELFNQIADKPYFQVPSFSSQKKISYNMFIPSMLNWRSLARIASLNNLYLSHQGKAKKALEQSLNTIRVGNKITNAQGPLSQYSVGVAMQNLGLDTIQKIAAINSSGDLGTRQIINGLEKYKSTSMGAISALKVEYASSVDMVNKMSKGKIRPFLPESILSNLYLRNHFFFNPIKTRKLLADFVYRPLIKIYVENNCQNAVNFLKNREDKNNQFNNKAGRSNNWIYFKPNTVGELLIDISTISFSSLPKKACKHEARTALAQLFLAIKQFENQNQKLPSSLSTLVPKYLSRIPQDPFSGSSLKYLPSKGIIYSIGPDNQDNFGDLKNDVVLSIKNPQFSF